MKISPNKTFPHPVLSDAGDDYICRAFQAMRDFSVDGAGSPVLTFEFNLQEESIYKLIETKRAMYTIEISCPTTYKRFAFNTCKKSGTLVLQKGDLYKKVEVGAFVVCAKTVNEYSSEQFNKEFGESSYALLPGDVLAVADTQVYWWDTEIVAPLHSVFDLVANDATIPGMFTVDTSGDKVKIQMHPKDKSRFENMRRSAEQKPTAMFLYFSAVAEVLRQMAGADADADGDKRWYRAIEYKLTEMGKNIPSDLSDPLTLAQELLRKPMKHILPTKD